jgi:hypothetical protein
VIDVAKRATKKTAAAGASTSRTASAADQLAEYIGASLGDLMNRKDALMRQLASVDQQIAAARRRVRDAAAKLPALPALPALPRRTAAPAKPPKARTGNRKKKRPLPPDDPMVAATTRARSAEAKARAAERVRSTRRAGNR